MGGLRATAAEAPVQGGPSDPYGEALHITEEYPDLLREGFVEDYDFSTCWTVQNPEGPMSSLDVAVALAQSDGSYADAAKLVKRSRRAVEGFVTRDPQLLEWAADLFDEFLDEVEKRHKLLALAGDAPTQRFFLETRGRTRGYVKKQEVDATPVPVYITGNDADL